MTLFNPQPGDITGVIQNAKAGDSIVLPAPALGSCSINADVLLRASLTGGKINTNGHTIAFASNLAINKTALAGTGLVLTASGKVTNVKITENDISGWTKHAIQAFGSDGLIIEKNYLHDAPSSDRTINIIDDDNFSYSYNTLYNVHDGGHIDGTHHHCKIIGNTGTRLQRMGIEFQDQNSAGGDDVEIAFNVFTDWRSPDGLSFGLSVMPQRHTNVRVHHNYISTGKIVNGVFTEESPGGSSKHYGYGIEWGVASGLCSDNVLAGSWVTAIVCAMKAGVQNNQHFGKSQWGSFGIEPGLNGNGTFNDLSGNVNNPNASAAPAPGGTSTTEPPMATKLVSPAAGTVFAPNDHIALVGSGANLKWSIDFIGDGLNAFPFTGPTVSITVPANATKIVVNLSGDGGAVAPVEYIVKPGTVTPPPNNPVTKCEPIGGYKLTYKDGSTGIVAA